MTKLGQRRMKKGEGPVTMHLLLLLCSFLLGKGEIWFQLQLLFVWDRSCVVLKLCVVLACHKPLTATRREVCWALLLGKSCLFFNIFVRPQINFLPPLQQPFKQFRLTQVHKTTTDARLENRVQSKCPGCLGSMGGCFF